MLRVYLSDKRPEIYYCVYSSFVTVKQVEANFIFFEKRLEFIKPLIYIGEYQSDAILTENDIIKTISKNMDKHAEHVQKSILLGIFGIRKLFLKYFLSLSKKSLKRELYDTREEIEAKLNFNFNDDFFLQYTSND